MRLSGLRVQQLIDAAMDEFLSKGFRRGSIENIARATGVGKATIYRHFTDKNGIFRAAVEDEIKRLETPAYDFRGCASTLSEVLRDFALRSLELYCRERSLTLHRTIIGAGHVFPALARAVHDRLTEWSLAELKAYLADQAIKGVLEIDDADWAAHQFVNLATHGILFLMTPPPADEAARRALADEAVELFLGGAPAMRTLPRA
ncbi:MAG TPA: TetR/AcrR family transcriptional regulator [Alphaproteobacteria bacterium]|jgi:AcrR family transcriptional regulator|nr:TetR/AcrR family transcriptional regulator [Alphaproteobacteria bacterium]